MRKRAIFLSATVLLFILPGVYLTNLAPNTEIAWIVAILLLTVFLFTFEIVPIDVAAISVMVFLGFTTLIGPMMGLDEGLININDLFNGFASNAVMSIIAVMIIGAGLDKTGVMNIVAKQIVRIGGTTETRIIPLISGTVGIVSCFMQNVGAAALFLPVVKRIGVRAGIPISRLLMPMGFCAILGGTLTLVGSSPLILLNDLILNANNQLPPDQQMESIGLFAVTPVGLAMLLVGIAYFVLFGRLVLPKGKLQETSTGSAEYFHTTYGLNCVIREVHVPKGSPLIGQYLKDFEQRYSIETVAVTSGKKLRMGAGGVHLGIQIEEGDIVAWIGDSKNIEFFAKEMGLNVQPKLTVLADALSQTHSGFAELIIPPTSPWVDESPISIYCRRDHGLPIVAVVRDGETITDRETVDHISFKAGDTVIAYTDWHSLYRLDVVQNIIVVTSDYPHEEVRSDKIPHAAAFLAVALALVLFTDLRLSVSLLTGALGMILTNVISAEEAYYAVSWKTVFLLASLIPLGAAVESSGTAAWIADQILSAIGETSIWVLQLTVATLATLFTLVMSNVGATVLLVPLAINIALSVGADPMVFALTVALATSNSFLIPTHQVNALIMGPGGYGVADFIRAGGIMTILFLAVLMVTMNLIY